MRRSLVLAGILAALSVGAQAQVSTSIANLPPVATPLSTDAIPGSQGATTYKYTPTQIVQAGGGLSATGNGSGVSVTATGGTTARTAAARAADVVNVMDFGASGNGTTDDTGAVQRAAAAATGKTLVLPGGYNFLISGTSTLQAGTTLSGYGATITAAPAAAWTGGTVGTAFVNGTNAGNITILGIRFAFPHDPTTPTHVIHITGGSNFIVKDTISDGAGDYSDFVNSQGIYEEGNVVTNVSGGCYNAYGGSNNFTVIGNYCTALPGVSPGGYSGVSFTGMNIGNTPSLDYGVTVVGNTFVMGNTTNGPVGILINGHPSSGNDSRIIVADNRIVLLAGVSAWGILVTGVAQNADIHDNYCEGGSDFTNGLSCVGASTGSANVKIHDNVAYFWNASTNGVFANQSTGGSLTNNLAYSSSTPLTLLGSGVQNAGNDTGTGAYLINNAVINATSLSVSGPTIGTTAPSWGTNSGGQNLETFNSYVQQYQGFVTQTAGVRHWGLFTDGSVQSGSNIGDNLVLVNYSDAGTQLNTALKVTRSTGVVGFGAPMQISGYTVATLPPCVASLKGGLAYVTDAASPSYGGTLTGGGSVVSPVFCSGSAWTSH